MPGSPLKWLKRRYLSGALSSPPSALAKWPELSRDISELQRIAPAGAWVGSELRSACPACAGVLIVGRERWRCLSCAMQEETGADLAGMREFLSRCPKAPHK